MFVIYFCRQVNINPPEWEGYTKETDGEDDLKLSDFENLILIKSFREEKVSEWATITIIVA